MDTKPRRRELHLKQDSLTDLSTQDYSGRSKRMRLAELDLEYYKQIIYLRNVLKKAQAKQFIKPALKKLRLPTKLRQEK